MTDLGKYLPLSQRKPGDESHVTSDWSQPLADTLMSIAALVDRMDDAALESPTGRDGYRVRDAIGHTLWRLTTSAAERRRPLVRAALSTRTSVAAVTREASMRAGMGSRPELAAALRALSATIDMSAHRTRVEDLSVGVVDGYDIAHTVGLGVVVDPIAAGAVALARSLSAPTEVRAVLRRRKLEAVDGEWSVGAGQSWQAAAAGIILFLWSRAGMPENLGD
ncbi:hypothetical protein [Glaciihabitans sp. dw_435]|uniref:hypothetical protein n=1 Tax=Glaciihabitans sp. dw_435 TaxID=2720081 RepID=UPI001BD302C5|nr:hypothetical protein [Glaciihabitans sp. dw_435]